MAFPLALCLASGSSVSGLDVHICELVWVPSPGREWVVVALSGAGLALLPVNQAAIPVLGFPVASPVEEGTEASAEGEAWVARCSR